MKEAAQFTFNHHYYDNRTFCSVIDVQMNVGRLFLVVKGFRTSFSEEITEKYNRGNFTAGYIIAIAFLAVMVYFLFLKKKCHQLLKPLLELMDKAALVMLKFARHLHQTLTERLLLRT